jgi:ADP-heptose:LPS heptosyltransferase/predicted O-methyltransferase YrrM
MVHLTTTTKDPLGLPAGERFLFDTVQGGHYMVGSHGVNVTPAEFGPFNPCMAPNHSRVLIIRSGGMGDVLFCMPALAALRKRFPGLRLTFACLPAYHAMLSHPDLEGVEVIAHPVKSAVAAEFTHVVPLEEVIESDQEHDAVTIFARALGLTLTKDEWMPRLRVPSDAILAAQAEFPKPQGQVFFGIQLRASHQCRTWPVQFIMGAAQALLNRHANAVVFMFGLKQDWQGFDNVQHPRVVWLPEQELTLTETLATMTLMDGFIAPDSGLLHCAGALGLPAVGLFGPFQWQKRTPYFPTVHGLNGQAPCAPCHHPARTSAFPPDMPCAKHGACVALGSLTPDRVVTRLLKTMSECAARSGGTQLPERRHYAVQSLFGPVQSKGDVHADLPRAAEYHLGNFGHGAATIEEAQMLHALVLALKPKVCVETGTETGWTAAYIAAALEANNGGHLTTLEIDPQMRELAAEHLDHWDLSHRVTISEASSLEWLRGYTGRPIDFALLDTHIPMRAQELALLMPHLSQTAVVCVHDTSPKHPGRGETDLLAQLRASGMSVVHVATPRGLTLMQRQ